MNGQLARNRPGFVPPNLRLPVHTLDGSLIWLYFKFLRKAELSDEWKTAEVVLIHRGTVTDDQPTNGGAKSLRKNNSNLSG